MLDILEEFDFYVRFNAIKLLATLAANRMGGIQQCILTSPMGITRLVDLLNDRREIIRNGNVESVFDLERLPLNPLFSPLVNRKFTVVDDAHPDKLGNPKAGRIPGRL